MYEVSFVCLFTSSYSYNEDIAICGWTCGVFQWSRRKQQELSPSVEIELGLSLINWHSDINNNINDNNEHLNAVCIIFIWSRKYFLYCPGNKEFQQTINCECTFLFEIHLCTLYSISVKSLETLLFLCFWKSLVLHLFDQKYRKKQ